MISKTDSPNPYQKGWQKKLIQMSWHLQNHHFQPPASDHPLIVHHKQISNSSWTTVVEQHLPVSSNHHLRHPMHHLYLLRRLWKNPDDVIAWHSDSFPEPQSTNSLQQNKNNLLLSAVGKYGVFTSDWYECCT